jgi:hypothetical protein
VRVLAIVGENGSRDGTRALLESAAQTGLVRVEDTSFLEHVPGRLQRMALGREFLASKVREMDDVVRAVGVVDVDEEFFDTLDPALLVARLRRLDSDEEVFAVAATSRPTYYDLLAFEDGARSFPRLAEQIRQRERRPIAYYRFFRDVVYPAQRSLTTDADIVCTSAFNGLCLYRWETFVAGSYLPPAGGDWICEHVTFHRSLARATGRSMVVDGSLVLPTPPEHGPRSLPGFVAQRLVKLVRRVPRKTAAA